MFCNFVNGVYKSIPNYFSNIDAKMEVVLYIIAGMKMHALFQFKSDSSLWLIIILIFEIELVSLNHFNKTFIILTALIHQYNQGDKPMILKESKKELVEQFWVLKITLHTLMHLIPILWVKFSK